MKQWPTVITAAVILAIGAASSPRAHSQSGSPDRAKSGTGNASDDQGKELKWLEGTWEHASSGSGTTTCRYNGFTWVDVGDPMLGTTSFSRQSTYSFTKKWAWNLSQSGKSTVTVTFDVRDALCTLPWHRKYKVCIRPGLAPETATLEIDPEQQGRASPKVRWSGTYRANLQMEGNQLKFLWDDGTVWLADRD